MVSLIKSDLQFILDQIKISERHASGEQPLFGPNGSVPAYNVSWGLRTVDGTYNNLLPGKTNNGAADQPFPEMLTPEYRDVTSVPVDFDGPFGPAPSFDSADSYAPSNDPNSVVVDP